nr:hypothetical protein [Gemmatimonadaceae bacterium]
MHRSPRALAVLSLAALTPLIGVTWQLAGPTPALLATGAALTGMIGGATLLHLVYRSNIGALQEAMAALAAGEAVGLPDTLRLGHLAPVSPQMNQLAE